MSTTVDPANLWPMLTGNPIGNLHVRLTPGTVTSPTPIQLNISGVLWIEPVTPGTVNWDADLNLQGGFLRMERMTFNRSAATVNQPFWLQSVGGFVWLRDCSGIAPASSSAGLYHGKMAGSFLREADDKTDSVWDFSAAVNMINGQIWAEGNIWTEMRGGPRPGTQLRNRVIDIVPPSMPVYAHHIAGGTGYYVNHWLTGANKATSEAGVRFCRGAMGEIITFPADGPCGVNGFGKGYVAEGAAYMTLNATKTGKPANGTPAHVTNCDMGVVARGGFLGAIDDATDFTGTDHAVVIQKTGFIDYATSPLVSFT